MSITVTVTARSSTVVISAPAALPINRLSPFLLQVGASFARTTLVSWFGLVAPATKSHFASLGRTPSPGSRIVLRGSCFQLLQQQTPSSLLYYLRSAVLGAWFRCGCTFELPFPLVGVQSEALDCRTVLSYAGARRSFLNQQSFPPTIATSHQPTAPTLHLLRRLLENSV